MARNGSGVYTLPATYNPVVSGTQITSLWANTTLNDIATALTGSIAADGQTPWTGAVRSIDGTVSSPGLTFNSETALGIYRSGSGTLAIAAGGASLASISSATTTLGSTATAVSGTLTVSGIANFVSAIKLNGSAGTSGQVLTSAGGDTCTWTTPGSPPVSSVTGSGSGISVSPTTGAVVVSNTGVTSLAAGTGISVSASTGGVTVTNGGVTSLTAGTGVSISASTGGVTVSIGQAVSTSSSPTFAGLTLSGALTLPVNTWQLSSDSVDRLYCASNADMYFGLGASGSFHFRNGSSNDVTTIDSSGNVSALTYNSTSDIRLKDNINVIQGALNKVKALTGVTFNWKSNSARATGLIAQDVQKVLPEAVSTSVDSSHLVVAYGHLVGLLVEAIKELATKVGA